MKPKYDYLVIGSGPAGHVSAIRAAQLGLKVAVVEKDPRMFGGVCLNEGCIPAKSLYHSAGVLDIIRRDAGLCGLEVKCGPVNMRKFVDKSREAAEQLKKGLSFLFKKNGIDVIEGFARFVDGTTVEISGEEGKVSLTADKFLIATGSVPRPLECVPFDGKRVLSSSHAIRLTEVPGNMLIAGGGYIGVEFASFFNTVGARVTIVEMEDSILPTADGDVSKRMRAVFGQKGITVLTSSSISEAVAGKDGVTVKIKSGKGESTEKYDFMIVSVGREPVTRDIGSDKAGVKTDKKGFIPVDGRMMTSVKNIFAAGDVVPGPMLAHAGFAEGEVAAEAAAGHDPAPVDYGCIPSAVFTDVQAASVGMTEEEARSKKLDFSVGKHFYKASGKAVVDDRTEGFVKIIADSKTREFLGVHVMGENASELIHEFAVAKKAGLTVDEVAGTVHAHPTLSETAADACRAVFGKAIHG